MTDATHSRRLLRGVAVVCTAITALAFAGWAHAATINVSTTTQLQQVIGTPTTPGTAAAGDTVVVAPGAYAPDAPLTVTVDNLTVIGSQTANTRINGSNVASINGAPPDMFDVFGNGFTLQNFALQQTANNGTVIDVFGLNATLSNSSVSANNGLVLHSEVGATFKLVNSTISSNQDAALIADGNFDLINTTIADNAGSGIANNGGGVVNLTNSIVSHNGLTIPNAHDCDQPISVAGGTSIASIDRDGTCGANLHVDPKLGPLQINAPGGTATHALLAGSPAINAGDNTACPTVDQRYVARSDGRCDIGAYEFKDTTPPVISAHADVTATATSASGTVVNYTNPTANDETDGPVPVTCSPASGSNFPVGTTTVTCTATDRSGNTGTSTFKVIVTQNQPPVITTPGDLTAEATGPSGAAVSYTVTFSDPDGTVASSGCTPATGSTFPLGTTTVNCTATDNQGATSNASFTITVKDTTPPAITVPADITVRSTSASGAAVNYVANATDAVGVASFSCTPASGSTFPVGTTTVNCSASDAAGNSSTASFHVTVVQNQPPVITVPADITAEATGPSGAPVSYTVTFSDPDGTVASSSCTPASGSTFPLGTTTVNCTATDNDGATSTKSFTVTVKDTTPPVISGTPADQTVVTNNAGGTTVTYTNPTASDTVSGSPTVSCVPASGSNFPVGTTTVTCTATDAAGNSSTSSFKVTVVLDNTAPTINVPADITAEATGPGGAPVSYTVTFTDPDDAATGSCTPASGSTFPIGTTTVNCTANDTHGNSSTASFKVTVQDTTPPVISNVPADITVSTMDPNGTVVNYTNPTANDPGDGPVPVNCAPPSGSNFPIGTTTVTCTATDAHNNTATATFKVTVNQTQDTTPPVITVPANITAEATGPSGAAVSYTVTFTDPDDTATGSCSPASGSTFPLGTTTVNCTASDSHGNTASASFTVTVKDTKGPVISGATNQKVNATSPSGATATYSPTANDTVSGSAPVSCTPASGSTFPIGTTTVTCTATDAAGNTTTATFTVMVLGVHDQIVALEGKVNAATNVSKNLRGKLNRQLKSADSQFRRGQPAQAKSSLDSFVSLVNANTAPAGPITSAQASDWNGDAARIKGVIG